MNKPAGIQQDIWDEATREAMHFAQWLHAGNSTGSLSEHAVAGLADSIARALQAQRKRGEDIAIEAGNREGADAWAKCYRSASADIGSLIVGTSNV